VSHGGDYFSDNERERHSSGWDPSIRGGVVVQRRRDDVPIRSVEVFIVSSANVREVREDDSGHDLGVFDQPEEVRDVDVGIAIAVTAGCTVFGLYGDESTLTSNASKGADVQETSEYGILLMLGYLFLDGFTSTFQDKLFVGYNMETYNQMLWVNFCSAIISVVYLYSDGSFQDAIAFIERHPLITGDIMILSIAAMLGQLCILYTINEFGALLFATIMTTRQFLSILLSCIVFMHMLSPMQWLGTVLVFGAFYYKSFAKAAGRRKR